MTAIVIGPDELTELVRHWCQHNCLGPDDAIDVSPAASENRLVVEVTHEGVVVTPVPKPKEG